ncbi:V-type ATPase subunit [Actinomadura sp. ATCC 31491]|uniref:V-type ATPase subunit n=1 Tax=Actinomadura luzonensis TaxID=2805427 RepID=A0ABT0G148_9ACTN|nr:V-type ATPase subunit [Actinomadura luzonensis]MCK2218321.1 V-type ATPase subunit [Actinomadura luzonensis]
MSGAWVAGATRARALVRRRLGEAGARRLARAESFEAAVATLSTGPYGHDVRPGLDPAQAQHAVAATLLWHTRVLAGWVPRQGADVLRLLARWFEIANVDALLGGAEAPFDLGALGTSWSRLSRAATPQALRAALASSAWGDPGGDGPRDVQLGMRLSWAARVADTLDPAAPWAAGAAALLVARERFLERRELNPQASARAAGLLGAGAAAAPSLQDLAAGLPVAASWALEGLDGPDELWRGEVRCWQRIDRDGRALLAGSGFRLEPVVGALAVLAADAWRTRAALARLARGADDDDAPA